MPIAPTYPGVYVEELPSGVHTITGVSTSVTAFLGSFTRGKLNTPVQVFSIADLERSFGPLVTSSEVGYSIRQFFANGGREAWVVRVASSTPNAPTAAAISMKDQVTGGNAVLRADAASEGIWGNSVRIDVDYGADDPSARFNLTVRETDAQGRTVSSETFRNLSLDPNAATFAPAVVNGTSALVTLTNLAGSPTARPAQTGTTSSAPFTDAAANGLANNKALQVQVGGSNVGGTFTLAGGTHATVSQLAALLQSRIRAADATLDGFTVTAVGSGTPTQYLRVRSPRPADLVTFSGALATDINIDSANVQAYALGGTASAAQVLPGGNQTQGVDGGPPDATALLGSATAKTGMYALEGVDIFNILCVPDTVRLDDTNAAAVISAAEGYCEQRRAFLIVDVPQPAGARDTVPEIKDWLDANSNLRHRNAALYFPRPQIPDPVNGFRLRLVPSSGTISGLYARTDAERGVWKAPAGADAVLRGVQSLEAKLTDAENGTLNPLAINNLRTFPVYGAVCWGARTLVGSDQQASEWKYIPIRRTALFIEESLYRGTKWAVFEPNDEPLWGQIRLNVGAFMHDLFRQGAFQGTTPRDAYFVKCDADTTTQTDRNLGIVNILVGFAPLKPAEFVIIQIQQIAGKIET